MLINQQQNQRSLQVQLSICASTATLCQYQSVGHICHPSVLAKGLLDAPAGQVVESDGSEEAAEAVENLLESYFMQIDGTYDRLVSIGKELH